MPEVQFLPKSSASPKHRLLIRFSTSRLYKAEFILNTTHAPWIFIPPSKIPGAKPAKLSIREIKSIFPHPHKTLAFHQSTSLHTDTAFIHVYCCFIRTRTLTMCPRARRSGAVWRERFTKEPTLLRRIARVSRFARSKLFKHASP